MPAAPQRHTPTYRRNLLGDTPAGTTTSEDALAQVPGAHPRAGGDHQPAVARHDHEDGSSPRRRGPPGELLEAVGARRLIPAHAGTTPLPEGQGGRMRAHCVPSSWGPRFRMGKFPTSGVWCWVASGKVVYGSGDRVAADVATVTA